MIHYNQLTDYQSEILFDGSIIGTLERLANEWYIIEIDYFSFPVSVDKKHLIHELIERVYSDKIKKEFRVRELTKKFISRSKELKKILE